MALFTIIMVQIGDLWVNSLLKNHETQRVIQAVCFASMILSECIEFKI